MNTTTNLTTAGFERAVTGLGITVVDFWAPWCGPCRAFAPIFEDAARRHPDVTFAKVNTQEQPAIAQALAIRSIPTLMAFRDGVLVFRQPRMLPAAALDQLVDGIRALDMEAVRSQDASSASV